MSVTQSPIFGVEPLLVRRIRRDIAGLRCDLTNIVEEPEIQGIRLTEIVIEAEEILVIVGGLGNELHPAPIRRVGKWHIPLYYLHRHWVEAGRRNHSVRKGLIRERISRLSCRQRKIASTLGGGRW